MSIKADTADTPDWGPLERLFKLYGVPDHVLGQWMYMGSYGAVRTYKHTWTREYVNLDCSRAYEYVPPEMLLPTPMERWVAEDKGHYRRIPKLDALDRVLNGNTLASSTASRPAIHGS